MDRQLSFDLVKCWATTPSTTEYVEPGDKIKVYIQNGHSFYINFCLLFRPSVKEDYRLPLWSNTSEPTDFQSIYPNHYGLVDFHPIKPGETFELLLPINETDQCKHGDEIQLMTFISVYSNIDYVRYLMYNSLQPDNTIIRAFINLIYGSKEYQYRLNSGLPLATAYGMYT